MRPRTLTRVEKERVVFAGGPVATLVLAVAALVVQLGAVSHYGVRLSNHAYGSVVLTIAGFLWTLFGTALIMLAATLFWTIRGIYTPDRFAPVINVSRLWGAMVVMWLIGFGVLHLGPHLT